MKRRLSILVILFPVVVSAQNVGIGTTNPRSRLEVNDSLRSRLTISSKHFTDTSQLIFRNRNAINEGTDILFSSNREFGLRVTSLSDITSQNHDSIMMITPTGRVGINKINPQERLDVRGNINLSGAIKINNNAGNDGEVLRSNGDGIMQWQRVSSLGGTSASSGYGAWGDCLTNSVVSDYQPVADSVTGGIPEYFGNSVAISGNLAVVGSPYDNTAGVSCGAAHMYRFENNKWVMIQKITEGLPGSRFGESVSISGNFVAIGRPLNYTTPPVYPGAVSIYFYNGTDWEFVQKITDPAGVDADLFGQSVCISGNRLIVGAPGDSGPIGPGQGSVSIYQFNGTAWLLMQKLTDATGASSDGYGSSVSIDGNFAIVGAPFDDNGATVNQGSSSVYRYAGATWSLSLKTTNPSAVANLNWGYCVSVSGNTMAISAPADQVGTDASQGTITTFDFNGTNWIYGGKIIDPNGVANDRCGSSMIMSGDYIIAGSLVTDMGGVLNSGGVAVFVKYGPQIWQHVITIADPGKAIDNFFGNAVGVDGGNKRFLIGSYGFSSYRGKAVFGQVN